jgi:excinuclease ABC subunit A
MPFAEDAIRVRGARVHNLKNLDCDIPLNRMTVVTGVSGSGKSSLAFDTLYAEGQRRYVESLSAYARQFLERMEKPEADSIDGVTPAIAIRQRNTSRNPRSTVGTATEIYDYLRILFARIGRTFCPDCGLPVQRDTVDQAVGAILREATGRRAYVLFPIVANEGRNSFAGGAESPPVSTGSSANATAATHCEAFVNERLFDLRQKGFNRLYQNGNVVQFSTPESLLDLDFKQPVYALADRLTVEPSSRARIVEAIEAAFRESGEVRFHLPAGEADAERELRFSERFECRRCGRTFQTPEPALFSFNNPHGACPTCQGFGNSIGIDMAKVIPDPSLSLGESAIEPWTKPKYRPFQSMLKRFAQSARIPLDTSWNALTDEQRGLVVEGARGFVGINGFFRHLERKKYKLHIRVFLSRYRGYARCPDCGGARLRPEALWVRLESAPLTDAGTAASLRVEIPAWQPNIFEICAMNVAAAYGYFDSLRLSPEQAAIGEVALGEIRQRLEFLLRVGLGYLSLDRLASTLSGGEAQRIQLATCLGSRLVGSTYVLDEPSIGLHSRDTARLLQILESLRDLGNTIVLVEHDRELIEAADYLLDLGPGAGENGGRLIAAGTVPEVMASPASLTGRYLSGAAKVPIPPFRLLPGRDWLRVERAHAHNLKTIDVALPLAVMTAVTGVSGSGKSTLVHDVIYRNLALLLGNPNASPIGCRDIAGVDRLRQVILVDQTPIGRTPRSNPVTYVKAFDGIRAVFAATAGARRHGFGAGHFSFNVPGGRCEACQGDGTVTIEMQFLADVELVCEECRGTRYKNEVLDVRFRGRNIHEVLQLTVREGIAFFAGHAQVVRRLKLLDEVGLGYLRLGQSATTLSGGEAQRIKLAGHLAQSDSASGTLFLFDEPTTGLHFDDITKLLAAFRRLIDAGGTVLVIEHNLDLIKAADWVIDLGPEGGDAGGQVVATGTPEDVAANERSHTGHFLRRALAGSRVGASGAPDRHVAVSKALSR